MRSKILPTRGARYTFSPMQSHVISFHFQSLSLPLSMVSSSISQSKSMLNYIIHQLASFPGSLIFSTYTREVVNNYQVVRQHHIKHSSFRPLWILLHSLEDFGTIAFHPCLTGVLEYIARPQSVLTTHHPCIWCDVC